MSSKLTTWPVSPSQLVPKLAACGRLCLSSSNDALRETQPPPSQPFYMRAPDATLWKLVDICAWWFLCNPLYRCDWCSRVYCRVRLNGRRIEFQRAVRPVPSAKSALRPSPFGRALEIREGQRSVICKPKSRRDRKKKIEIYHILIPFIL